MSSKGMTVLMCITMIAAIVLVFALAGNLTVWRHELICMNFDLTVSRSSWEHTAAEKESFLDELQQIRNAVKEANLTYEEESAKIAKYTNEIESLRTEISELEKAVTALK